MCGFLRLKKNTTTCLQTELLDKDGKMNLLPLFFFFFPLYFCCRLVTHTIYPCVCTVDKVKIEVYGDMCL